MRFLGFAAEFFMHRSSAGEVRIGDASCIFLPGDSF